MYIEKLKIGNVELENNILLAPMAGVTDLSYRKICKKYGNPGLVCTEMISSKGLFYNDKKTEQFLVLNEEKRPIAIQIFGSDPSIMGQAAKIVEQYADIIDINMGCPAPKVVKNGDGSKLLLNLELVGNIVKEVAQNTTKPVTVKIRKGWDDEHIVAVEAAKVIEKAGASAITVHGRTFTKLRLMERSRTFFGCPVERWTFTGLSWVTPHLSSISRNILAGSPCSTSRITGSWAKAEWLASTPYSTMPVWRG